MESKSAAIESGDISLMLSGQMVHSPQLITHTYNRLLDENSRKLVLLTLLRTMGSILEEIDGVACYIDDIIITGKTD